MKLAAGPAQRLVAALVGLCCLLPAACTEPPATRETEASLPAASLELGYEAPSPGTYILPVIQPAADGATIDADGTPRHLFDYMGDRYVVLSFIYTACADGRGCPFATAIFHTIGRRLENDAELAGRVRLISLSFDPGHDTPDVMRLYAGDRDYGRTGWQARPWVFLTTASKNDLRPILDGYGQYVVRETDENGSFTGRYAHVLKVFLIDRQQRVRNIYSTSYLHPGVVINDIKTLLMEEPGRP